MSTLTLEITPETYHKLSEYTLDTGKTIDLLGREFLEMALDAHLLPKPESVRDILQRNGRIRPLGQTLQQKIQPDITLADVRQALNQAAGPALSEIVLAQRGTADNLFKQEEETMTTASYAQNIKYITDPTGKRQEVVIPFQLWKELTTELEALHEKQKILLGLQQACREVKLQEQGNLPEQTLEEFLDEL